MPRKNETRICSVDGCGGSYHCKGVCRTHYQKLAYQGLIDAKKPCVMPECENFVRNSSNLDVCAGCRRRQELGFTPELISSLRIIQGWKCAICKVEMTITGPRGGRREVADHCHATGRPRGLLCFGCNTVLGIYEKYRHMFAKFDEYLANTPAAILEEFSYLKDERDAGSTGTVAVESAMGQEAHDRLRP